MAARESKIRESLEEMEDAETVEDDNEVPVILQCKNCNSIVGDSMAWVCANDGLKTVTLHSVTNAVMTGKKLMTSTAEGIDLGSTYVHLQCKQCKDVIGRIYKTTSRQLDNLRDLYTFSVHQIMSYQVGTGEQTANVELQDMLDLPTAKSLKDSILKTQVMICALNNRILNIENSLEIKDDDSRLANNAGSYGVYDDWAEYNTTQGMSAYKASKKLPTIQEQDKTAQQNDDCSADRETSTESAQNERQYNTGKRTNEPSTAAKTNKRSRFK